MKIISNVDNYKIFVSVVKSNKNILNGNIFAYNELKLETEFLTF